MIGISRYGFIKLRTLTLTLSAVFGLSKIIPQAQTITIINLLVGIIPFSISFIVAQEIHSMNIFIVLCCFLDLVLNVNIPLITPFYKGCVIVDEVRFQVKVINIKGRCTSWFTMRIQLNLVN